MTATISATVSNLSCVNLSFPPVCHKNAQMMSAQLRWNCITRKQSQTFCLMRVFHPHVTYRNVT